MSMRTGCALLGVVLACACGGSTARASRELHYVGGELVHSPPAPSRAYEAYLRAQLALQASPPRLQEAMEQITVALDHDARDAHLWTTKAEIHWRLGQVQEALASCRRALELRPGYAPARSMMAKLEGGSTPAAAATPGSSNL
jgi:Tfp pilus assembly protein PilF